MRKRALLVLSLVGGSTACVTPPSEEIVPGEADTCEAEEPVTRVPVNQKASLCEYGCAIAATLECGIVQAACTAGSMITIGGVTIPCAAAALATCVASAAGAVACVDLCKAS